MQGKWRYIGLIMVWFVLFPGLAAALEKNVSSYPLTDFSKPLLVTPQNPLITINLPTNPATGYQWFLLQYDEQLLEPVSYHYLPSATKLIGSPGVSTWQFRFKKAAFVVPRVVHIEFEYRRSWEASAANRQSMTIITEAGTIPNGGRTS